MGVGAEAETKDERRKTKVEGRRSNQAPRKGRGRSRNCGTPQGAPRLPGGSGVNVEGRGSRAEDALKAQEMGVGAESRVEGRGSRAETEGKSNLAAGIV
jgi:hypothetical protein